MNDNDPKVIIECPGETWCYGIPKKHVLTKSDPDYKRCLELNVGDVLTSHVGHFDYNIAMFEVELTVREASVTLGGDYLFKVEFTRAHSNSNGWEDVSTWSKT